MATSMKRVVPWFDRSEWENVFREIYSGDRLKQQHALDRIAVWKCRVTQRLSTAIECTCQLVSALLQDPSPTGVQLLNDAAADQTLRMLYGVAVVRFVSLVTEKGQTRLYALRTQLLAEKIGIPEWVVSLRHETAHGALPSLARLRQGVLFALDWLKREYWEAEMNDNPLVQDEMSDSESSVDAMIGTYAQRAISDLLVEISQYQYSCQETCDDGSALTPLLNSLRTFIKKRRSLVLTTLVDDGYLVCSSEQLTALGIDSADLLRLESGVALPDSLTSVWSPVLELMARLGLTSVLLDALVERMGGQEGRVGAGGGLVERLCAGWMHKLLSLHSDRSSARKTANHGINGRSLLKSVLLRPNRWTSLLLPSVFAVCTPALSGETRKQLTRLVHCYTTQLRTTQRGAADRVSTEEQTLYTVDMLTGAVQALAEQATNRGLRWQLATERVDWSACPLGHCPGQSITYTSLELPPAVNGTTPFKVIQYDNAESTLNGAMGMGCDECAEEIAVKKSLTNSASVHNTGHNVEDLDFIETKEHFNDYSNLSIF